jgi:hypothetical protein
MCALYLKLVDLASHIVCDVCSMNECFDFSHHTIGSSRKGIDTSLEDCENLLV